MKLFLLVKTLKRKRANWESRVAAGSQGWKSGRLAQVLDLPPRSWITLSKITQLPLASISFFFSFFFFFFFFLNERVGLEHGCQQIFSIKSQRVSFFLGFADQIWFVTYSSLLFLFSLKNVKIILSSHAIQKQVEDWFWPAGYGLLIHGLEDN